MDNTLPSCRVCLKNAMEYIDLEGIFDENSNLTYFESFNFCTHLNAMIDDDLPKYICNICSDDMKIVFDFIQKAHESDKVLRDRLKDNVYTTIVVQDVEHSDIVEGVTRTDASDNENAIEIVFEDSLQSDIERSSVEDPKKDTSDDGEHLFKCNRCPRTFKLNGSLRLHMRNKHKKKKIHLCNVCGKICSQRASLESHIAQHSGERPYVCEHCDKSYFTKNGLQAHMYVHTDDKIQAKFLCSACGKGFATCQRLRLHNLVHTGEKNFQCNICSKKFATVFRLKNHTRIHTGERPFECKECGLKFAQSNALRCHERIHTGEKPYECKVCGKRFNQNTILKTHMTLHTGKTVKCPDCDKKFSRPSYLILHQREHTGEKPYLCPQCPNRYKQKSHLDRHLDTHYGIKHSCNECGKEYSKRSSLKIHMFEHSEQKPFQCSDCNLSFTRKDKYRSHLKRIHNKILENNQPVDIDKSNNDETTNQTTQETVIEFPSYILTQDNLGSYQVNPLLPETV